VVVPLHHPGDLPCLLLLLEPLLNNLDHHLLQRILLQHNSKPQLSHLAVQVFLVKWQALQRKYLLFAKSKKCVINRIISGVAVGSSIGHAIGGFFGGGASSAPLSEQSNAMSADQSNMLSMDQSYNSAGTQYQQNQGACANDVNAFRQCMDQNQGSLNICGWYLDQLKACQQAASQY